MERFLRITTLISVMLFFSVTSFAGILKGKATDTKGEALPFATVYVQGSTQGTTANEKGEYQLTLPPGTYKISCQYMGFKQSLYNVTFAGNEIITHNFSLQDQSYEMKAVVVKANSEDPAYGIIRKVIKRRKFHLDQVHTFQTSIYMKGAFRNNKMDQGTVFGVKVDESDKKEFSRDMGLDSAGKGMLYLCEEEADYYAQGNKRRTIIRSVRESGNPNGLGISQMPPVITFYENKVRLIGTEGQRAYVSPISENALHYYKYKYEGEFRENGVVIDKIKVIPRRAYEPLLSGTIYIAEDDWAVQGLDLVATQKYGLELLDTMRIEQVFLPLRKDTWVPKSQVLYFTIKILILDMTGNFLTVYNNQKVNEPVPDSLFEGKTASSYDAMANKKDTSYWTEKRPVPLQTDESRDYIVKDSIRIRDNDPKLLDSIRRDGNKFNWTDPLLGGYTYTSKGNKNKFSTNAVISSGFNSWLINYNTVEGVNVAPKLWWTHNIDTGKTLSGQLAARYGFSNTHFNAIARLVYKKENRAWKGRDWSVGIEGGKYVFQYDPQSSVNNLFNTVSTLFYGKNYLKLYEGAGGAAFVSRNYGNGFRWSAKIGYQQRIPLNNTTTNTLINGTSEKLTSNVPATPMAPVKWEENDAATIKLSASYKPGYTYTQYPDYKSPNGSRWPLFTLNYEKGIPNIINSKSDFDKWRFGVEDDISLKLLGSLVYDIAAGGFLNKNYVSLPDMMHVSGNQMTLAGPYLHTFQLAPYYRYSNTESIYGELHMEYYMKGLLTNKIPLLRQARVYFVLGTNTFYASQSNYYSEAFVGLDNIGYKLFRVLRVDLVHSWNSFNQPATGIRIGIRPGSLFSVNAGKADNWQ